MGKGVERTSIVNIVFVTRQMSTSMAILATTECV